MIPWGRALVLLVLLLGAGADQPAFALPHADGQAALTQPLCESGTDASACAGMQRAGEQCCECVDRFFRNDSTIFGCAKPLVSAGTQPSGEFRCLAQTRAAGTLAETSELLAGSPVPRRPLYLLSSRLRR